MNKAIQVASGQYLLFLNSGDHFNEEIRMDDVMDTLDGTDLIAWDIRIIGDGLDYVKSHPDPLRFSFLVRSTLAHQSVFIRRALFDQIGLYDHSLRIAADWKFFIHAIGKHQASYKAHKRVLTHYYLDGIIKMKPNPYNTISHFNYHVIIYKVLFKLFISIKAYNA